MGVAMGLDTGRMRAVARRQWLAFYRSPHRWFDMVAPGVDAMAAVVKPITGLTPKDMAVDIGVPLHKGAAKFYKEKGAI